MPERLEEGQRRSPPRERQAEAGPEAIATTAHSGEGRSSSSAGYIHEERQAARPAAPGDGHGLDPVQAALALLQGISGSSGSSVTARLRERLRVRTVLPPLQLPAAERNPDEQDGRDRDPDVGQHGTEQIGRCRLAERERARRRDQGLGHVAPSVTPAASVAECRGASRRARWPFQCAASGPILTTPARRHRRATPSRPPGSRRATGETNRARTGGARLCVRSDHRRSGRFRNLLPAVRLVERRGARPGAMGGRRRASSCPAGPRGRRSIRPVHRVNGQRRFLALA